MGTKDLHAAEDLLFHNAKMWVRNHPDLQDDKHKPLIERVEQILGEPRILSGGISCNKHNAIKLAELAIDAVKKKIPAASVSLTDYTVNG